MAKPHVEAWNKKEFIVAMQHKGKLPRFVTEAKERHDHVYHETTPRIFPGPGGMDTVLEGMLTNTQKRIDTAQEGVPSNVPYAPAVDQAMTTKSVRQQVKERLKEAERALVAERKARQAAETQLLTMKVDISTAPSTDQGY